MYIRALTIVRVGKKLCSIIEMLNARETLSFDHSSIAMTRRERDILKVIVPSRESFDNNYYYTGKGFEKNV